MSIGEKGVPSGHTPWPLRNSKVFHSLNALMERCNDLTELVHTIHDFRYGVQPTCTIIHISVCTQCMCSELEAAGRGVGVTTSEAVIGDIYSQFTATVQVFTSSSQVNAHVVIRTYTCLTISDLLWHAFTELYGPLCTLLSYIHTCMIRRRSVIASYHTIHTCTCTLSNTGSSQFEFGQPFRVPVLLLPSQGPAAGETARTGGGSMAPPKPLPSDSVENHADVSMFLEQRSSQGRWEKVPSVSVNSSPLPNGPQTILAPHHKSVVAAILSDVEDMTHSLTTQLSHPTLFLHTPPVASKLLWLHGLGERASGAMGVVRSAAPELLEGELGWKLRHVYSELIDKLQRSVLVLVPWL